MPVRLFLVCITPALIVALSLGVGWLLLQHLDDAVSLPVLAITGVILLIGVLALVAVGFKLVGLANPGEALGLPPGSVRGVIALSLVVLFAILTVFLFSSLNTSKQVTIAACLTAVERTNMLTALGAQQIVSSFPSKLTETGSPCPPRQTQTGQVTPTNSPISPTRPPDNETAERSSWWSWCLLCWWSSVRNTTHDTATTKPPPSPPPPPDANTDESLYAVYTRDGLNQASVDFAKQLLVLIGTLVTSVAGFYFGSKAVSDAQASTSGTASPPKPHNVSPTTLRGGGEGPVTLMITGESLNDAKQVRLEHGDSHIDASEVLSNAGSILAKITIGSDVPGGLWDVVVTDGSGRNGTLKDVLTITGTSS